MSSNFPSNPSEGQIWQHPVTTVAYQYENGKWKANSLNIVQDVYVNATGDIMSGDLTIQTLQGVGSTLVSVDDAGKLLRGGVADNGGVYFLKGGDFATGDVEIGDVLGNAKVTLKHMTGDGVFTGNVSIGSAPTLGEHAVHLNFLNSQLNNLSNSYLQLIGGNLSGDITIASNKISLGVTGDASFAGTISAVEGNFSGEIKVDRSNSDDLLIRGSQDGSDRFRVYTDGRIEATNSIVFDPGISIVDDNQVTHKAYVDQAVQALITEDDFVNTLGDNMSGNLTFSTDKIVLNATSGGAILTGPLSAADVSAETIELVAESSVTEDIFVIRNEVLGDYVKVDNSGNTSFLGDVTIDGNEVSTIQYVDTQITNLADEYLSLSGGNILANVTFGTTSIELDLIGSARFAGGDMLITTNGDVLNTNNVYGSISDKKLKTNIKPAESQWRDIKAVNLVNYEFKPSLNLPKGEFLGVISQELKRICPGLISTNDDYVVKQVPSFDAAGLPILDKDGNQVVKDVRQKSGTKTESVKYSVLHLKALGALQECMSRIEALEAEVRSLKRE